MRIDIVIVLLAMLLPFISLKSNDLTAYFYWFAVTALYLLYISIRRWEVE
ncbi:hypothetical protein Ferp_2491 [Ferroglobus placidus DSM 10642]|uniref:Uncharacterized protein n=1 Tax=Ferroglobus placidus (strain DSM 10642 / AEDII12DO) TaxID=589924 RepID=D3S2A7_FERPA|nr:hypothetical protein [Ferroglobus placidus]ADC66598.1 hypothetical protein Ferp_2491 [Ferroglobus placidus DSM 10642]